MKWIKIAEAVQELQLPANGLKEATVNGKQVCLALHNHTVYACMAKCPHAGGIMANGHIDATGNIVCPLHRYRFNLNNGRNVSGEGYYLKTYPVEVRADGVYMGFK